MKRVLSIIFVLFVSFKLSYAVVSGSKIINTINFSATKSVGNNYFRITTEPPIAGGAGGLANLWTDQDVIYMYIGSYYDYATYNFGKNYFSVYLGDMDFSGEAEVFTYGNVAYNGSKLHLNSFDDNDGLVNIKLFNSNSTQALFIDTTTANVGIGTKNAVDKLTVNGNINNNNYSVITSSLIINGTYTPSSSSDPYGYIGQVVFDDNYLYRKTIQGWKRIALESSF